MRQFRNVLLSLLCYCGMLCLNPQSGGAEEYHQLYAGESPYASVRVFDTIHNYRVMSFGRQWQTVINPKDPEEVFYVYARTTLASLALHDGTPKDLLLVGLGGGSMANYLQRKLPGARIDIVEIDPLVVSLAKRFFDFRAEKFSLFIEDGRRHLRKNAKKYDLILLDAYKGDEIPFHLTTREFVELLKSRLNPNGIVAFHLWEPRINRYFEAQIATIYQVFPRSYLFFAGDGSYLVFAPASGQIVPKNIALEKAGHLTEDLNLSFHLGSIVDRQYQLLPAPAPKATILTDDYAPVNRMRMGK